MRKYLVLTSVLALAACGGGSGGGSAVYSASGGYSTPADVRAANANITQMETFSSSADAIVAAVSDAGIDLNDTNSLSGARAASTSTLANSFSNTATTRQTRAMAELKNMYLIATDDDYFADASEQQLRNAFVIAGNDIALFDASDETNRAAVRSAIVSNYEARLDAFVAKDGSDYLWIPIISTLEDVQFKIGGEDSYIRFALDESGKITALGKYDRSDDFSGDPTYDLSDEGLFERNANGNTFAKNLYMYSFKLPNSASSIANDHREIEFRIDNEFTDINELKTFLKNRIDKEMDYLIASQPDTSHDTEINTARNFFKTQVDDVSDFDDLSDFDFDGAQPISASLTVQGVKNGLRFADLGYAELIGKDATGIEREHTFSPYVGGYDSRKIDKSELAVDGTVFTGVALAGIDHKIDHSGDDNDIQEGMLVRQDNAVLTMKRDGSSVLEMNNLVATDAAHAGKHWYNLTVETSAAGLPTFTVTGDTNATGFELPSMTGNTLTKTFEPGDWRAYEQKYAKNIGGEDPGEGTRFSGFAESVAYGPSESNPTEATARFGFGNEVYSNSNQDHEEVAIYGAFGGKH
jgi:hypothetical protein